MPTLNLNQLDDVCVYDRAQSFLGGQVSSLRANQLGDTQWFELINVDINRNGRGTTRRGTAQVGAAIPGTATRLQGLFYYDTPSNSYLIAANNGKLYSWQSPNWVAIAAAWTGTDVNVPYGFAQGVNTLFYSDGIGTLHSFDGTTLVDLGGATNADPPPAPGSLAWFTDRLILSKIPTDPDALYFSDFLDGSAGHYDRTTQQLRVSSGEGDPITGHYPWVDNNLFVMKKRSLHLVDCDPLASANATPAGSVNVFKIKPIHRSIGCLAPYTAAQVDNELFFLSTVGGVRKIQRTEATDTRSELGSEIISEPIQDIIDRINQPFVSTARAFFWNNRYFLALPLDSATTPNYVAVFNKLTGTWSGVWTGWTPTAFSLFVESGYTKMAIGHSDGKVSAWLDFIQTLSEVDATFQDCGVDIATTMTSRAFIFDDPLSPKTGLNVDLEFYSSTADCTLKSIINSQATPQTLEGPFATYGGVFTLPAVLPFILPSAGLVPKAFDLQRLGQFRELQLQLKSPSKKLSVGPVIVSGFIDSIMLQTT